MLRPLNDYIVVKPNEEDERVTEAGLILMPNINTGTKTGDVLRVGPGGRSCEGNRHEPDVQEGDRVLFNTYGGVELMHEGEKFLLLRESEILAVLE